MDNNQQSLKPDEAAAAKLRALYTARGFRRVRTGRFEEYDLYMDNRNFLHADHMITFMDPSGRLLALKPDVTLSIVKNIPQKPLPAFEKLFYVDEVYRLSRESGEYKVHNQIGVELIGPADAFATVEVVDLALESLGSMTGDYVLDISHLGFVYALLEAAGLSHSKKKRVLAGLHAKSAHNVSSILEQAALPEPFQSRIMALCELHGSFPETLEKTRGLVCNSAMEEAFSELERLGTVLDSCGHGAHVNLDFSVVNDLDYYNGLVFLGYIHGIPNVVLTGGRYDNLMAKMGKQSGAIGFAVSLSELNTYLKSGREYDFDLLVSYPEDCDYAGLLTAVRKLYGKGYSVRLEREDGDVAAVGIRCRKQCRYVDGRLVGDVG